MLRLHKALPRYCPKDEVRGHVQNTSGQTAQYEGGSKFFRVLYLASTLTSFCYKKCYKEAGKRHTMNSDDIPYREVGDRIMTLIKPDLDRAQYGSYQEDWIVLLVTLSGCYNGFISETNNSWLNEMGWVMETAWNITNSIGSNDIQSPRKSWQDAWIEVSHSATWDIFYQGWEAGSERIYELRSTITTWCDTWEGQAREREVPAMAMAHLEIVPGPERATGGGLTAAALMDFEKLSPGPFVRNRKADKAGAKTISSVQTGSR